MAPTAWRSSVYPSGIAVDAAGILYVADTYNNTIRMVVPMGTNWVVTTIAGNLLQPGPVTPMEPNAPRKFTSSAASAVDSVRTICYVADAGNNTIREIRAGGHQLGGDHHCGNSPELLCIR